MQCPKCVTQALVTSQRRDIDIDHCPKCGGVWLDRGELEKVISLAYEEQRSPRNWAGRGDERDEAYARSARRDSDDDDEREYEREGRYEEDDDDGDYRERGRYGGEDRGGYQNRERETYGRENERGERETYGRGAPRSESPSIWRELFENLEKLPLPRV